MPAFIDNATAVVAVYAVAFWSITVFGVVINLIAWSFS